MRFQFSIGQHERHRVSFSFNQFWGNVKIAVDDIPVARDFRLSSTKLIKRYEFVVGVNERHTVIIEKERPLLFAGFRPQCYRVFVDGQSIQTYQGY